MLKRWLGLAALSLGVACLAGAACAASKTGLASCAVPPAKAQIMPLGGSITYGIGGSNGGYRGPLYDLLHHARRNFVFVGSSVVNERGSALPPDEWHHEGHSAYDIVTLSNNLDGLDASVYRLNRQQASRDPKGGHWLDGLDMGAYARPAVYPDAILLMVGTDERDSADGIEAHLVSLLDKIVYMRPQTWVLVAEIPPMRDTQAHGEFVDIYNPIVAAVVARYAASHRVRLIDLNTGFPVDGLSGDSIHPNDIGYAWIARQWEHALMKTVWGCQGSGTP